MLSSDRAAVGVVVLYVESDIRQAPRPALGMSVLRDAAEWQPSYARGTRVCAAACFDCGA